MARHEPNYNEVDLTPLLDLVLQMVMFFMVCANFASQQLSMNVLLAQSRFAKEVQPGDDKESLIINVEVVREEVRVDGKVEKRIRQPKTVIISIFGVKPIKFWETTEDRRTHKPPPGEDIVVEPQGLFRAQTALNDLSRRLKQALSERENKPVHQVKLPITVVLRADREIRTGIIHNLMLQCKASGFPRVELSTLQEKPASAR